MHIEPHGNGGVRWVDCSEIGLERTMVRAATNFVRRIVNHRHFLFDICLNDTVT
jgi:hypothetical protein